MVNLRAVLGHGCCSWLFRWAVDHSINQLHRAAKPFHGVEECRRWKRPDIWKPSLKTSWFSGEVELKEPYRYSNSMCLQKFFCGYAKPFQWGIVGIYLDTLGVHFHAFFSESYPVRWCGFRIVELCSVATNLFKISGEKKKAGDGCPDSGVTQRR